MSLFWMEGKRPSGKYVKWAKAKRKEPAGTVGMKAPEVKRWYVHITFDSAYAILQLYFTGEQGEQYISLKADIWAGNVTMMKVLVGFGRVNDSTEQVHEITLL